MEKKKLPEKKKKVRKSAKSSSESDDDRKHKKKRKSSTTSETHVKESKKRKSIKGEIDETEAEYSSKEVSEENPISSKKLRDSNKSDVRSNMDLEPDNDADDSLSVETKKSFKGSCRFLFYYFFFSRCLQKFFFDFDRCISSRRR